MTGLDEADRAPVTGGEFAGSFVRSFPMSGQDRDTLAAWFDLAIDAGRRQGPPGRSRGLIELNSADEHAGRLLLRAGSVTAVEERPDATVVVVDGQVFPVVAEYDEVVRLIART